jgi:hypothetical protein
MPERSRRFGRLFWLPSVAAAALVLALLGIAWWRWSTIPLPPYSPSRYLNVGPDAQFIGTSACAQCHPRNHDSYRLTEHSKALSDIDPNAEPPDGSFEHARTGRTYRVYRQGKELRHEESLRTRDGMEIGRADVPVRYVVGSGHFTRTYLAETDGFLHESPITWYASKQSWGMSPGYDTPSHWGFERPTAVGCLVCHAGRVETVPGTVQGVVLHEKAIGCESCHGPGSLHQASHRAKKPVIGAEDFTIVNPGKLARRLQEAVCSSCHLNGPALVLLRGRGRTDFRPGRPLTDYRIDYRLKTGTQQMTIVGHVEQLQRSACYQKSSDLTCITCHDMHAKQRPTDRIAYYRQKCLDCHSTRGCSLPEDERLKTEATDNCVRCHMPRGDTDVPHVAFTHHRIGLHKDSPPNMPSDAPELVPADDISHVPPLERKRNLGMAYLQVMRDNPRSEYAEVFRARASDLLEAVHGAGLRDPEVAAALAHVYSLRDVARSAGYAREVVEAAGAAPDSRATALLILASAEMQEGKFSAALPRLEQLVRMRRYAEDWRLLGLCYLQLQGLDKALPALQHAESIRPFRFAIQGALSSIYQKQGDGPRAEEHAAKLKWLMEHRQD